MIYIEMNTLHFLSYNSSCLVSKQNDEDEGCDTSIDTARKSHTTQADSSDGIDDNENDDSDKDDDFADDNDYKPENISDDYRNENVLNEESNDDDDKEEEDDIGSDNENNKGKPLTGTVVA